MWNPVTINVDKPLYIAVVDALERDIRSGQLKPGQQLPTHRELADIIGVNVSTITRSYKEAERRGLISGTVGRGTFVSADVNVITSLVRTDTTEPNLLEMGLVLPLYEAELDMRGKLEKLAASSRLEQYLKYTDPLGLPEHREVGAQWAKKYGVAAKAEDIVVCAGSQHAITSCLLSLFQSGDRIAVESLTYPGIKTLASMLGIRLVPIAADDEGMLPEALDMACRRDVIRGVYLIPGVQNPTTACMSLKRRKDIAETIQRNGLTLIEDDAYSFTRQEQPVPISALIPENSVFIAGVSKAFYAGLRVSFAAAPKHLRLRIAKAVLNTLWMAPTLNVALVAECITDGTADRILTAKREAARKRNLLVKDMLKGYSYNGNDTGFFIWLKLPDRWPGKVFESKAREAGISVFSAERFAVGGAAAPDALRISLTGPATINELGRGLSVIRDLMEGELIELSPML